MNTTREQPGLTRRDFLRLKNGGTAVVVDVSCQQLHMSYLTLTLPAGDDAGDDPSVGEEPPTVHARRSVDDLFRSLTGAVREANVVRVRDPEWLRPEELCVAFVAFAEQVRSRGGVIEFSS